MLVLRIRSTVAEPGSVAGCWRAGGAHRARQAVCVLPHKASTDRPVPDMLATHTGGSGESGRGDGPGAAAQTSMCEGDQDQPFRYDYVDQTQGQQGTLWAETPGLPTWCPTLTRVGSKGLPGEPSGSSDYPSAPGSILLLCSFPKFF